jgi:hypothetical protein
VVLALAPLEALQAARQQLTCKHTPAKNQKLYCRRIVKCATAVFMMAGKLQPVLQYLQLL